MTDPTLLADVLVAFNLGIVSTLHCLGMCGGIAAALALGGAPAGRAAPGRRLGFALAYNLGRIASYTLAGLAVGVFGEALAAFMSDFNGHRVLRAVAGLVLVLAGVSLAGWLPRGASVERLGAGLWRQLQPLGRHLLPIDSLTRALAFGMLWGWLPCALVYSTLMFAAASGDAIRATLIMLAFGTGTAPTLVWFTFVSTGARRPIPSRALRLGAAVLLIAAGCAYPFIWDLLAAHQGHAHH